MQAYLSALEEGWAEPARLYAEATRASALLEKAREEIASFIGSKPSHTHFAPSPAVAAERIVQGIHAARRGRRLAIVSGIERRAVVKAARFSSPDGVAVAPVDDHGMLDLSAFMALVADGSAAFAAIAHASCEVGTLQPLDAARAAALAAKVPLVVDASATIGHVTPPRAWDALVANPGGWGGPGGIGVLALRPELKWVPAWADGAPWAPGSTHIPAAVAAATALRLREQRRATVTAAVARHAQDLRAALAGIPHTVVHGRSGDSLPHIVGATFVYANAAALATRLDAAGIAVAAGCSCRAGTAKPCRTLRAMGAMTHGFLRFGLHEGLDDAAMARVVKVVATEVATLRREAGAPG